MRENISLIGIGKLGICFGLNLERAGYNVLGIDVNQEYVDSINKKTLTSFEPYVEMMLSETKHFVATTHLEDAVQFSDDIFVLVATPSLSDGRYDHSQITNVVDQLITLGVQKNTKYLTICCTTMPGHCDVVQKRLEDYNYVVSYNPEFIAQGTIILDQKQPDIILIGEGSEIAGKRIRKIYERLCGGIEDNMPSGYCLFKTMSRKAAEITKISLNCFLTSKIAFANMIGDLAIDAGIGNEVDTILEAIGSDKRIGSKCLKFGYGYGGPCFPRDNRALSIYAHDIGAHFDISHATDLSNEHHLSHQHELYRKNSNPKMPIVFTSVAYKPGTVILEESQKLKLAIMLANARYIIIIRDSHEVIRQLKELYGNLFRYEVIDGNKR